MVGITRINIQNDYDSAGGQRILESKNYWPIANNLYHEIFTSINMPLLPGEEIIECTRDEFRAGYDYELGIDVIIRPKIGGEATLQEKFLFTDFYTVTVEHCQDWLTLEPGNWFKLKAQYYFVGYDFKKQNGIFDPWVLLNWPKLKEATAQGKITWHLRDNDRDKVNAKASFIFTKFINIPSDVIVQASFLY